ncbi:MAG: TlyA family RNA methyltransferase [Syntrophales bacterium]|nr:TlyA family RNA methyltransferase [Syntrophales bacterium]
MDVKNTRERLDKLLVDRGLSMTRERARALIMSGAVIVGDCLVDKPGVLVPRDGEVRIRGDDNPYVSRGGLKLKGALLTFGICVKGLVVLDVGASTGGFTDCLLQEGAGKVYALDCGYGQLAWKLRKDRRVTVIERTNIRYFEGAGIHDEVDMAVIDTSFISLKLVISPVLKFIKDGAMIIALIKPQFEVGQKDVGKQGVVRDPELQRKVVEEMTAFCEGLNLEVVGTCESPLLGPAGNREFFIYAKK